MSRLSKITETKYSRLGIERTAIIPSLKFIKWLLHYMASPLFMTAIVSALTIAL